MAKPPWQKLSGEKILGNLSEERFQKLPYKYEDEQTGLKQRIRHLKKVVAEEKQHEMNADGFLKLIRQYTDIQELTPEILHTFIEKVVGHHSENVFGEMVQGMETYYKTIGYVELPEMSQQEKESYMKRFGYTKADRSA